MPHLKQGPLVYGGVPSIWVTFPWGLHPLQLFGAQDCAEVSIGTGVFLIYRGALEELYQGVGGGPCGGPSPSGVL